MSGTAGHVQVMMKSQVISSIVQIVSIYAFLQTHETIFSILMLTQGGHTFISMNFNQYTRIGALGPWKFSLIWDLLVVDWVGV